MPFFRGKRRRAFSFNWYDERGGGGGRSWCWCWPLKAWKCNLFSPLILLGDSNKSKTKPHLPKSMELVILLSYPFYTLCFVTSLRITSQQSIIHFRISLVFPERWLKFENCHFSGFPKKLTYNIVSDYSSLENHAFQGQQLSCVRCSFKTLQDFL